MAIAINLVAILRQDACEQFAKLAFFSETNAIRSKKIGVRSYGAVNGERKLHYEMKNSFFGNNNLDSLKYNDTFALAFAG